MNVDDAPDDEHLWPWIPRLRPIPDVFYSLEREGPFQQCTGCGADLREPTRRYVIERIFRGSEPIVEYAMCVECQEGLCAELSQESLTRAQELFRGLDHQRRLERLRGHGGDEEIDPWISECIITGKSLADCRGYQIVATCQGMQMELSAVPLMISDEGVAQLLGVMSKKTRDRMEDFFGDTFGMPPEFCERPDFFPVIL